MKKFNKKYKDWGYLFYRLANPLWNPINTIKGALNYPRFLKDLINYRSLPKSEKIKMINIYPCLNDGGNSQAFDSHYFYQDIWAFDKILKSGIKKHIDIGSRIDFVGFLSKITNIDYVDIRSLDTDLKNLKFVKGDILNLPYGTNSVLSLSCLHVAEHIGLGRYGDKLDPQGTEKACRELSRILAPKGDLYFSLPVGRPRLCFNAHRIHSPGQILGYFSDLKLIDFSAIGDDGHFIEDANPEDFESSDYACGLFHFKK